MALPALYPKEMSTTRPSGSDSADTASVVRRLPDSWLEVRIGDVGDVLLGVSKSPERRSGAARIPFIRAANVGTGVLRLDDVQMMHFSPDEAERFALLPGDILLAEASGSPNQVGRSAMWRGEIPSCCFQNTVIRFRATAIEPDFAQVIFQHFLYSGVFADTARGVGIQHLSGTRFSALPIPVPPVGEQLRIVGATAERLSSIDAASEALESALARVNHQDQAVLAAAVRGELDTDREPTATELRVFMSVNAKSGESLNEDRSLSLFDSDRLQSSTNQLEMPEWFAWPQIPSRWRWTSVAEVGKLTIGRQLTPLRRVGRLMRPYLRVANVLEDRIDIESVHRMAFDDVEFEAFRLAPGDILLNEGQSLELIGRPAMFRGEFQDVAFQNTLIRFQARGAVLPEFALIVFRHYMHSGVFQGIARRSTNIAHLGLGRLAELPFPVPPLKEQYSIVLDAQERLAASREQRRIVEESLRRLTDARREVFAAAAAGNLVPQLLSDGRAIMAQTPVGDIRAQRSRKGGSRGPLGRSMMKATSHKRRALADVLTEQGPLRLPDLLLHAGYDRDSIEDVQEFYLALREATGRSLRVSNGAQENAIIEAIHASA